MTGPEPSSPREQIAILAGLLDREIEAVEVPVEQAQSSMLDGGWPQWAVERMGELFDLYAQGLAQAVSPDVERVTGSPPHDYRRFAADHLGAFIA